MANVSRIFDPITSFVRLLEDVATRVEDWQLSPISPSEKVGDKIPEHRQASLRTAALHIRLAAKHMLRAEGRDVEVPDAPGMLHSLPTIENYEVSRHERSEAISQREAMRERGLELRVRLDKHHAAARAGAGIAPGAWCSICGERIPLARGFS